jgi:hypothetical protein
MMSPISSQPCADALEVHATPQSKTTAILCMVNLLINRAELRH